MFYMKGEGVSTMIDDIDRSVELNRKLDIILTNKQSIESKLSGNGISPFRRTCLEYQLECLEKPIGKITTQLMGST